MLVLTRKQGERIQIGDDVVITIVRTKGKCVRLGIQAPSHVPVLRGEIARVLNAGSEQPSSATIDAETVAEIDDDVPRGTSCTFSGGRGPLHALVGARSV
jgi:carbon storage regulator